MRDFSRWHILLRLKSRSMKEPRSLISILGDPGAVSRAGLKGATKVFKHGRLSPDHFHTVKRMLVPDWAQKMLCIIVPNRQTASPEFFS